MIIKQIFNNLLISLFGMQLIRAYPRPFERYGLKGSNLIGTEIGVYHGEHAYSMFKTEKIKKLYLIDPYEEYGCLKDLEDAKKKAYNLLKDKNVEFIYKKSEDAVGDIPNELDFVYIDGAHDYDNVKKDIENYWDKVKVGGVFGGHDCANGKDFEIGRGNEVIQAVVEFVTENDLKLYIENRDWWVIKEVENEIS